jgi:hypothetical protein
MSDPGKAVFLSYASQEAETAKGICEALPPSLDELQQTGRAAESSEVPR